MRKWLGGLWLGSLLACLPALAQNDLMLSAPLPAEAASATQPVPQPGVVVIQAGPPASSPSAVQVSPAAPQIPLTTRTDRAAPGALQAATSLRVVLLLPGGSPTFRAAAQAVQDGFTLAATQDRDERLVVSSVQTGDDPTDVLGAYQAAQAHADIIVGPLTRSGVSAVATRAQVSKTTVALAQAEPQGERELRLHAGLLSIGLSVDDEARQLAQLAQQEGLTGRAYILHAQSAWQRRAARAFEQQWRAQRQVSETMEISSTGGWLDMGGLQQLKRRLDGEQPRLLFAALDVEQASQLREGTGQQLPMLGTSLLNPLPGGDWPAAARRPELDGVLLLDLPWLLQPQHPVVSAYRSVAPVMKRSAELERLFALGIDAWRVVRELASGKERFELDGVTGRLLIDLAGNAEARFQRHEVPAVYEDGMVVPRQP